MSEWVEMCKKQNEGSTTRKEKKRKEKNEREEMNQENQKDLV